MGDSARSALTSSRPQRRRRLAVLGSGLERPLHAAAAPLVLAVILFATWHRTLLRWDSLVGLILVIVLFVPITKYRLPANLPFQIELYRLVVALVVFIWITSLLIDRRVRLERTAFDKPLLLIVLWAFASEVANPVGRVAQHLRREVADVLPQLRPGLLRHRERDPEAKRGDPAQGARPRVRRDRSRH